MPLPDFHVSEPFTLGIELEMQVVNPPGYDLSQDSSMLIDAVKNKITAGEVKHDITESMLELATDVCRDINQAAGQFSAMQKVVLQAATDHHLKFAGGNAPALEMAALRVYAITNAITCTLENFGYLHSAGDRFRSACSMLAAPVAMTPFICWARLVTICAALYRPFRRVAIYAGKRIRVLPLTTEYFFRLPDTA